MTDSFSVLTLAHAAIDKHVRQGDFCIDATAGRGHDTAYLCNLVGETGRVLAMDIQEPAIESTRTLLEERGLLNRAQLVLDSHGNMAKYAQENSAACITFNFGWLPGGDHSVFTQAESSIAALEQGLRLLRPGGIMSLCIYYGRQNGTAERDALLEYLRQIDHKQYTALLHSFWNRPNNPPLFALVYKDA